MRGRLGVAERVKKVAPEENATKATARRNCVKRARGLRYREQILKFAESHCENKKTGIGVFEQ